MKRAFVTVGTTDFDLLIVAASDDDFLRSLARKKYTHITYQIGRGKFVPKIGTHSSGIEIACYRYKDSLAADIESADLVIGHSGAGTCIEVLTAGKPFIVVVNESLHDNHQLELAKRFAADEHLVYCVPASLQSTLDNFDPSKLRPYQAGDKKIFANWLDSYLFEGN